MRRSSAIVLVASLMVPGLLMAADAAAGDQPSVDPRSVDEPSVVQPSVVVVGMPGLRWSDVDADLTPYLWSMVDESAVGQMSTRAARSRTCPVDGWLQMGTGNRARYPVAEDAPEGSCPRFPEMTPVAGVGAQVDGWPAVVQENEELAYGASPGLLATTIADSLGQDAGCTQAVGQGSGLAAADLDGWVDRWVPEPVDLTARTFRACPFTAVAAPPLSADRRAIELVAFDALVRDVDLLRPDGSVLMVLGVSDLAQERSQLHVALVNGPGFSEGLLVSGSTRRAPFVQLSDVAPTVLDVLDVSIPSGMTYQPMRMDSDGAESSAARVSWLRELAEQAEVQSQLTPPFFGVLVLTQAILYLGAYLILRRHPRDRTRSRVLGFTHVVAVAAAAGPAATYLANLLPWWEAEHPVPGLLAAISLAGAVLTAVAFAGPWRRHPFGPAGAVAGATALVLVLDIAAGAPLQLSSLAGYSPIVAGRFVGFGNLAFAIFGTATLLATAAVVSGRSPRTTLTVVSAVAVVAVIVDGAPALGSDFGGVIALVPAFGTLGILASGRRLSWARLAVLVGAGVVVVGTIATLDYLRPEEDRTHLGRFVESILTGDAGTVVQRKIDANLSLLTNSVLTLMVPLVLLFLAFLLRRPSGLLPWTFEQVPTLRAGLAGVLVLGVVGALLNDSGVAIPAMAATVAIPVAVAVMVRCMGLEGASEQRVTAEPERVG